MKLFISSKKGSFFLEGFTSSDTILKVKEKIQEKNGTPPGQQDLFYNNKYSITAMIESDLKFDYYKKHRLVNEKTLNDYGIFKRCVFYLNYLSPADHLLESLESLYLANKLSKYDTSDLCDFFTITKFRQCAKLLKYPESVVKAKEPGIKYHLTSCNWNNTIDCNRNCSCSYIIRNPEDFFRNATRRSIQLEDGSQGVWHQLDKCFLVESIKKFKPSCWEEKFEPCCKKVHDRDTNCVFI